MAMEQVLESPGRTRFNPCGRDRRCAGPARWLGACCGVLLLGIPLLAAAQPGDDPDVDSLILPQHAALRWRQGSMIDLSAVEADVTIRGQVATTNLTLSLANRGNRAQEARIVLPVPDGATVHSFQYDGVGPEPTARILPRDEARRLYNAIVRKMRDPGLLEFAGYNLIRTSAFPVPPGKTQSVRLVYEQVLMADADRVDYFLPRSESLEDTGITWTMRVRIESDRAISTVYSPSHEIRTKMPSVHEAIVSVPERAASEPGPWRVSYLMEPEADDGLSGTIIAYPDPSVGEGGGGGDGEGQGGYFLFLTGFPRRLADQDQSLRREVILVLDRSGSMRGSKIDQAREAALEVIEGLDEGDSFNIIDYSNQVETFAERPVVKSAESMGEARRYLRRIKALGGTNIHDALVEALREQPADGVDLSTVLFLTDGLPTVGKTSEVVIREAAIAANGFHRRIFTFGVGYDVNSPLLTHVADASRGATTFVLPEEDVEVKVAQVFRRLSGHVIQEPTLVALDAQGQDAHGVIREVLPAALPDLFEGDQMVVLGQYTGRGSLRLRLGGRYLGKRIERTFRFDLSAATTRNSYVPRLWASRRIATLIDAIRQSGADGNAAENPKTKELVEEIVRLSRTWGILTEYTSFLAIEDNDDADSSPGFRGRAPGEAGSRGFQSRRPAPEVDLQSVLQSRSGLEAVRKDKSLARQRVQEKLDLRQTMARQVGEGTSAPQIRQVADRTLYRRGSRWVDARLLDLDDQEPQRTVEFGTPEYDDLVDLLVSEGRQGLLAVGDQVYLLVRGERVLVKNAS